MYVIYLVWIEINVKYMKLGKDRDISFILCVVGFIVLLIVLENVESEIF